MFTGLIEEQGEILRVSEEAAGRRLRIGGSLVCLNLRQGDSVAVSGVCQTVAARPNADCFEVVAVGETLKRTTLGDLREGARVNLERALRVGDRLGGHWVNGHVDATAVILERRQEARDLVFRVSLPVSLARYVVEKGSIAVDGVSLTVGKVDGSGFFVHIIPETAARTRFGGYGPGERVNLEVDILAKYVESLLRAGNPGIPGSPRPDSGASERGSTVEEILRSWNEDKGHDGRE